MKSDAIGLPISMLDLRAQYAGIREEIESAISRVVESQQFILGPEVEMLEREVAEYCGAKFAIGVSSGTDALLASLMALGVGPGDEVLTTPYTFVATGTSILRVGAIPKFADIDPVTFNVDLEQVECSITPRTKVIVPVHLFGQMADMKEIMRIADRHGVSVIEDAAQAIGAERDNRRAGTSGAFGCLSFFPTKNLGAFGDAGMVLTNDERHAARVRLLRSHGQEVKYLSVVAGGNFRMDAIQAAILRVKLRHLPGWIDERRAIAETYRKEFARGEQGEPSASARITLPREVLAARHTYHQFVIRASRRDEMRAHLAARRIESEVYYPRPLHIQATFEPSGYRLGDFPNAEAAAASCLALPCHPGLSTDDVAKVVRAVEQF